MPTGPVASPFMRNQICALFLCTLSTSLVSCGRTQAAPAIPMNSVMQTIREYGQGSKPPADQKGNSGQASLASDEPYDSDGPYQAHLASLFVQNDFAELEKQAHQARVSKARLNGGVWKLFCFYEGVGKPPEGEGASDSDWKAHFAAIKKWIAAYPESAAARIALANTYVNYAWAARGHGYSDSVSERGQDLYGQRIELGKAALVDAARLKEKCPYWYEVMQDVALAQGWDRQQARELFDQATAFDPTFYHFYREYANFLLPKWYGEEGETQAFAEEVSKRLPEKDGSITYFEIASLLACQCDKERDSLTGMSWPTVKQGYAELQRRYGTSNLKMNRFAYMSFVAGDKSAAREAFSSLGDSWNPSVWRSAENFAEAKTWAATLYP